MDLLHSLQKRDCQGNTAKNFVEIMRMIGVTLLQVLRTRIC